MPLLIVGIGILILLVLISKFKINAFLALLITTFAVGLMSNMNIMDILDSVLKGIGDTMGKVMLILAFGASMLGKILEESGAAHAISYRLIDFMGLKNIQYALLITGFLVGLQDVQRQFPGIDSYYFHFRQHHQIACYLACPSTLLCPIRCTLFFAASPCPTYVRLSTKRMSTRCCYTAWFQ